MLSLLTLPLLLVLLPQDATGMRPIEPCAVSLRALRAQDGFERIVHDLWHRSLIFRRQVARLASEPTLVVSVQPCGVICPRDARARTVLTRELGLLRRADIRIKPLRSNEVIEMIAHELEHVLEQLDGVNLSRLDDPKDPAVRQTQGSLYETVRARRVGLAVAKEYRAWSGSAAPCGERDTPR